LTTNLKYSSIHILKINHLATRAFDMPLLRKAASATRAAINEIAARLPIPQLRDPVFIIGCGRSGTTILGAILSKHTRIKYLNERRDLWYSAYPVTDIWTARARKRGGSIALSERDENEMSSKKLSRLFRLQTLFGNYTCVIDKLPINNFRLHFIKAAFPDARFIHIYRNGIEVARSIDKLSKQGSWYGKQDYKWFALARMAEDHPEMRNIEIEDADFFRMGLIEWRFSTEAAVEFLKKQPVENYVEISYARLMDSPKETVTQILGFIGLELTKDIESFIDQRVSRRSKKVNRDELSAMDMKIGGGFLTSSMNDEIRSLTNFDNH